MKARGERGDEQVTAQTSQFLARGEGRPMEVTASPTKRYKKKANRTNISKK